MAAPGERKWAFECPGLMCAQPWGPEYMTNCCMHLRSQHQATNYCLRDRLVVLHRVGGCGDGDDKPCALYYCKQPDDAAQVALAPLPSDARALLASMPLLIVANMPSLGAKGRGRGTVHMGTTANAASKRACCVQTWKKAAVAAGLMMAEPRCVEYSPAASPVHPTTTSGATASGAGFTAAPAPVPGTCREKQAPAFGAAASIGHGGASTVTASIAHAQPQQLAAMPPPIPQVTRRKSPRAGPSGAGAVAAARAASSASALSAADGASWSHGAAGRTAARATTYTAAAPAAVERHFSDAIARLRAQLPKLKSAT